VDAGEPGVGPQVGHLVGKPPAAVGALRRDLLEVGDLAAQLADPSPGTGVVVLQPLHGADQRLVARDLVGGRDQLRAKLGREEESKGERGQRDNRVPTHSGEHFRDVVSAACQSS